MSGRLVVLVLVTVAALAAQDPPSSVGRLSYVGGSVSFQPGGVNDWVPATINRPLTVGDQIYADAGARAEIHVPGAAFRLGSKTAFEFMNLDDRNVQVRLSEGSLNLRVRQLYRNQNFEIDTPNLALSIDRPGDYRIDANSDTFETYVTVRNGEAQVTGNAGSFPVHAREQAVVAGQDQAQYHVYAAPAYDEFDNWSLTRDRRDNGSRSSRYVSQSVVGYEDLDEYGSWRNVPQYGNCWVPRNVPSGWAPYHDGHWAWVDPWGWSWVDDAPWGFAPYHYGRWAHFGDTWGWVPGPAAVAPVYAPALVAWVGFGGGGGGISASFGFGEGGNVGWFPLGPRDVYVPAYRASQAYVTRVNTTNTTVINNTNITNVYNNYVQTGRVSTVNYANRTVPGALVAVPQNALTTARPVQQVAVKVSPAQISAMREAAPAPRVAPQAASVLGRPASAVNRAPRPPAAVVNRPVVAKSAPPPPPPAFQQRQSLLAQNPGRPLPIQQERQIARSAPVAAATRPDVRVVAQARTVTPHVTNAPAPRPTPAAMAQRPGTPPAAVPNTPMRGAPAQAPPPQATPRPFEPPSAPQRQAQPAPLNRPVETPRPQNVQPQQNRPFEPPAAQQRQAQPAPTNRPAEVPRPQNAQPQQTRPFAPPAVQQRQAQPVPPDRPAEAPRPQNAQPQQTRPFAPPSVQQRQAQPVPPNRPAEAPRPQNAQPQQTRPFAPPSAQQRQAQPAPPTRPAEAARPQNAQPPRPSNPPPQEQRRVEPLPGSQGRNRSAQPQPAPQKREPAAQRQPSEQRRASPPPTQERKASPPARPSDEKKRKDDYPSQ
jgi:hypothetical protein